MYKATIFLTPSFQISSLFSASVRLNNVAEIYEISLRAFCIYTHFLTSLLIVTLFQPQFPKALLFTRITQDSNQVWQSRTVLLPSRSLVSTRPPFFGLNICHPHRASTSPLVNTPHFILTLNSIHSTLLLAYFHLYVTSPPFPPFHTVSTTLPSYSAMNLIYFHPTILCLSMSKSTPYLTSIRPALPLS